MSNNLGVWHKTTFEAAKERQQTYQATVTVAGHKRNYDQTNTAGHSGSSRPPPPSNQGQNNARPRQVPALPRESPRLTASKITTLENGIKDTISEYSQRRQFQATPTLTADPLLSLSHPAYALPNQLVQNFASLGIHSIYPWQKQCLLGPGLLRGQKNLVYTAPTGGGKSLVADVLMLKQVVAEPGAKALLVLPYVALVQEKVAWLRQVVQGMVRESPDAHVRNNGKETIWRRRADEDTIRVVGFFGGINIKPRWADFDIGVCTLEKANALVNTAIDDCSINQLRVAVLDELHMIDDDHRGYLFELLSTKLLCLDHPIQIIGMSATLTNAKLLSTWLGGHHYETGYRPVPIEEHLVYDGKVYSAATTSNLLRTACQINGTAPVSQKPSHPMREVASSSHKELSSPVLNAVVALANETAMLGYGVLIFSSSRAICESNAILISRTMPSINDIDPSILDRRKDLLADLASLNCGLDPILSQTIPYGAGLTSEERDLVAKAYDNGILKICVATASLAAGINLPARRVILHSARMGRDLVGPSMLRQMRGRAGRKGKDEVGETYLCCQSSDLDNVLGLMHAELPHISSSLTTDRQRIQRALLEVIAIRLATSRSSLDEYIHKTLLYHSADVEDIEAHVETSLASLEKLKFITMGDFQTYEATQLGKAIVAGALDPEDGTFIHNELKKALQAFVMDGDLHVLYTFTPVHDFASEINWRVFWNEMEGLDESGLRVLKLLGLKPTVINRMVQGGQLRQVTDEEKDLARVYRRFYMALQLRDLCNEMPVHVVARKYDVPRGTVQNLAQNCQGFAAGMIKFCEHMGWGAMASVLDHFSDRLKAGAKSDLLSLAKITFIKSRTARVFWDNGFKSVASVANADPEQLVPILMQAQSNKIRLNAQDDRQVKEKLLIKARAITESANRLWQREMQEELMEEEQ
ncbi:uncharacterized protein PgNI_03070 [Pyricularia grisea]|uniref:Uncharacterized protein n=1 Tax=Pyricularia grisea TaxID=148305 RepID=A0A6P8B8R2_PYRGI|nr:uncharacterized protein PgNI_03070 [Pyricularia grisea]TLD12213.1 hypothetical protein PgNI_03070 [Pyricularia grisea]